MFQKEAFLDYECYSREENFTYSQVVFQEFERYGKTRILF